MRSKKFYLTVLDQIKAGNYPAQICKDLDISKQKLNYYLSTLKRLGTIRKIGYGTWEYLKDLDLKEVKKSVVIGKDSSLLKQDTVRGHGFLFKFKIKDNLLNWNKREEIFIKNNIKFDPYYVGGIKRGQRIIFRNRKVALTDRSIIINFPESYIAETSIRAKKDAIYNAISLINGLENFLKADFKINKKYMFKVSRQHYALIKNSLAKQYDKEGKKLECYTHKGLWLIIDNSYNLHELETLHKDTADTDNTKVQNFFHSLKENPITSKEILDMNNEIKSMLKESSENQIQLGQVLKQMEKNIIHLTKIVSDDRSKRE